MNPYSDPSDYEDDLIPEDMLEDTVDEVFLDHGEIDQPLVSDQQVVDSEYRGSNGDPVFGFLLAIAVSIGLTPILPAQSDLRYTLAWGALALVSVLAWLLGKFDRIGQEKPENLAWGGAYGLLVSVPFVLFFFNIFSAASRLIFPAYGVGTTLAYLLFVMPLAETLFFRGLLQPRLELWFAGGLAGLWSIILFFPVMWGEILEAPAVAIFLAIGLLAMNLMYSYIRERYGLAAAWIGQILANIVLLFIPSFL
jgi:membrane protease YdiL (CAAX protease family)